MVKRKQEDIGKTVTETAVLSKLKLFDPSAPGKLSGVRVFDVGQGDCIGLRDQHDEVFCYIDYGGLNDHPDKDDPTYTAIRLNVKYGEGYTSIVLTHWDKDHFWSAYEKNSEAQKCEWLVPRQMASPSAVRFAAKLEDAKCWPETRGIKPASFTVGLQYEIEIRKCGSFVPNADNEDRNLTGLAINLVEWNSVGIDSIMLLPGDCPFDKIPSLPPAAPISALVAYHHGAKTHFGGATALFLRSRHANFKMVYSHGKNRYGHPERRNYKPHWDKRSDSTKKARARGDKWVDMSW